MCLNTLTLFVWARRGRTTGGSPDVRASDPNDVGGRRRQTRPGRPEGVLPAPGESMYTRTKCQQGQRPSPPCRSVPDVSPATDVTNRNILVLWKRGTGPESAGRGFLHARWWRHEVLKLPNPLAGVRNHRPEMQQHILQSSYS